ncbi:hypothetical protein FXO38_21398 [Capsicum annuum]|uniref:MADS-box domain-containing protein n=1 Tax=Capsicum annuum TaxID=4072 RepID=A0A2G2ZJT5_CAPAN|nr:hypothetical protein FXO38_21398 [Capsicum annuum]KAF3665854.1 hypothetical protein FXO37_10862 [Capsicum annuum]PHT82185.1 hypothetical protein T459_15200 [Capsicum annuum]
MTKKGVRTTRNLDSKIKKAILEKRFKSLCKKAKQLSIRCDIEAGIIAFSHVENNIFAWPSVIKTKDRVENYFACIELKKLVKFQKHQTFLQSIVDTQEKYIDQMKQKVEKMEMDNLCNELVNTRKRFDELEDREIKGLLKLFAVKRTKLEERKQQLNQNI